MHKPPMNLDIAHLRLQNQKLSETNFNKPEEVVQWLGAMQAQDYFGALWAVGLRLESAIEKDVESAFNSGSILRTHLMRPTWHFVHPADIRWLLKLTGPRVHAGNAGRLRELELDETTLRRSSEAFIKVLQGGKHLSREELRKAVEQAGIFTTGQRFPYMLMSAELNGVLVSGRRSGKQFTYALLEERVPKTKSLSLEEALAELTRRYFTAHGPAQIKDFAWWSGLSSADIKKGIELVKKDLASETIDGKTYWMSSKNYPIKDRSQNVFLLPAYDEFGISYKDRSASIDVEFLKLWTSSSNAVFNSTVVVNGRVVGSWRRTLKKSEVIIETKLFHQLNKEQIASLQTAVENYGRFLNLKTSLRAS